MLRTNERPAQTSAPRMTRKVTRGFDGGRLRCAREGHPTLHRRAELARVAGIGVATLDQWERGVKSPSVHLLARVAEALGVGMDVLVCISPDQRYLSDWRVLCGKTQLDIAGAAGLSGATIGRLESAEIALTGDNADRLAGALDIPVREVRAAYERARIRPAGTPA